MKRAVGSVVLAVCLAAPALADGWPDAPGATLRWLDKLTGETADIDLPVAQSAEGGPLRIRLDSCRYPSDNPMADAEAHLTITDARAGSAAFDGWMVASSPALSALDHPRYDVWVLHCDVPADVVAAAAAAAPTDPVAAFAPPGTDGAAAGEDIPQDPDAPPLVEGQDPATSPAVGQ